MASSPTISVIDDGSHQMGSLTAHRPLWASHGAGGSILSWIQHCLNRPTQGVAVSGQEDVLEPSGSISPVGVMVSARWMEPDPALLPGFGEHVISEDGVLLAVHADEEILQAWSNGDVSRVQNSTIPKVVTARTLDAPWNLLDLLHHALGRRIENMTSTAVPSGVHVLGDAPVRLEAGAKVDPGVVLDAEAGGIWIEANARVRPGAVLVGPVHVGPDSIIREQAVVRGSDIGPTCRVAGETNNSILQGWCNRAHEGHVGDSVLGVWSNLGAGTTISNLLNSYEEVSVRMTPGGSRRRTNRLFVGAFVGDFVRTAIGTKISTGTVIGTGAMLAEESTITGAVPSFAWWTPSGRRTWRFDKFVTSLQTVMARRGQVPSPEMLQRLRDAFTNLDTP
jgi:UDP-N-acetylglucosamine diphosphorylase/glucosamine-1-phosphate N-acetyltransferase